MAMTTISGYEIKLSTVCGFHYILLKTYNDKYITYVVKSTHSGKFDFIARNSSQCHVQNIILSLCHFIQYPNIKIFLIRI